MLQSTGDGDDEADVEAAGGEATAGDDGGGCSVSSSSKNARSDIMKLSRVIPQCAGF